jgi:hypothetical protein
VINAEHAQLAGDANVIDPVGWNRPSANRTRARSGGELGPLEVAAVEGFDAALQLLQVAERRLRAEAFERESMRAARSASAFLVSL